jgi:hypothetical protein
LICGDTGIYASTIQQPNVNRSRGDGGRDAPRREESLFACWAQAKFYINNVCDTRATAAKKLFGLLIPEILNALPHGTLDINRNLDYSNIWLDNFLVYPSS